jgi:zinc/manganese transport system permease protein
MELLFDPLFRLPFLTGLLLALALPWIGTLMRLQKEWLAALGVAHMAGAGAVLATLLALPALPCAIAVALAANVWPGADRNQRYGMMIILGWTLITLSASLSHHAHGMGQMLMEGQLYFVAYPQLVAASFLAVIILLRIRPLHRALLRYQLMPSLGVNRGQQLLWRTLSVAAIAIAAMTFGVMAAFAMLLIPPTIAFRLCSSWRQALLISLGVSVSAYISAFIVALLADVPFGPTLTGILILILPLILLRRAPTDTE